jgi:hypothetical protein
MGAFCGGGHGIALHIADYCRVGPQCLAGSTEANSATPLAYRCHIERAPGERSQEFGLRFAQVKPGEPILRTKHYDLAVMIRNNVWSWRGRQHRERRRVIAVPFPPNSSDCRDRRPLQREAVLGLRIFLAGELKKCRRGNEATAALVEMSSLRPKIEDRRPSWSAWWKAESHRHEFDLVARGPHHRSSVVDPDVVGLRQIELALSARNPKL